MKISRNTLAELVKIATGDSKMSPYRSGPKLVQLFNQFGWNDFYEQGFPSRWKYTEERLLPLNGSPGLRKLIDTIFDAGEWIGKNLDPEIAAAQLNKFLKFDGYELVRDGEHFKVRDTGQAAIKFDASSISHHEANQTSAIESPGGNESKAAESKIPNLTSAELKQLALKEAHGKIRVLAVGINNYPPNSGFHRLKKCVNDANEIALTFRNVPE